MLVDCTVYTSELHLWWLLSLIMKDYAVINRIYPVIFSSYVSLHVVVDSLSEKDKLAYWGLHRWICFYYFTPFAQFCKRTVLIDKCACVGGAAFDISTLTSSVQASFLRKSDRSWKWGHSIAGVKILRNTHFFCVSHSRKRCSRQWKGLHPRKGPKRTVYKLKLTENNTLPLIPCHTVMS